MKTRFSSVPRSRAGMTLVEVMVVLLVLLLVAAGVSRLLVSSWQSEQAISGQNLMQKLAQQGADSVVDRIRGASEIVGGDEGSVTAGFANGDTVTYYLQDGALRRDRYRDATGETTSEEIIHENVTGLHFEYYHHPGMVWVPAPTAVVAESLRVSVTAASGKDHATQTSGVKLRNKV